MENLIEKHKKIAEEKNEILRELYITSGILSAYKYPVREIYVPITIADLEIRMLALEQRLRVKQREIEGVNNVLNFQKKRN
jgi:hypothetical protein